MLKHNKKISFRFGNTKIVFNQQYNEPEMYVYAKALVYEMYHRQYRTIKVEANVDERFQPDLCAVGYDGIMLFWAECGNTSMDKIEKLFKKYRKAHYVFVKEERDIPIFTKNLSRRVKGMHSLPAIDIITYPPRFKDWWVSEEGDVFLPKDEVTVVRFNSLIDK